MSKIDVGIIFVGVLGFNDGGATFSEDCVGSLSVARGAESGGESDGESGEEGGFVANTSVGRFINEAARGGALVDEGGRNDPQPRARVTRSLTVIKPLETR